MSQQANLRVQVLGVLAVAVDGRAVPAAELASRKGRTLLKLLLARRGSLVPAEVAAEVLWGGRPPAGPEANLATLVSRLRAVLGPEAVAGDRQGWRFVAGPRVEVDLDEAERLTAGAEARLAGEPALALAAAERSLTLLGRGSFLADEPDADWAQPPRREAEQLTSRARRLAWDAALAVGDHPRALAHARAATTADPFDESAWRAAMLAHTAAGEPAAALAAYEHLRQTLADELGTDPAPDTQSLHLTILRGAHGPEGGGGAGTAPAAGMGAAGATGMGVAPAAGKEAASGAGGPALAGGTTTLAAGGASDAWFVGREGELAELGAAWNGAVGGRPGMVLVVGEAGIGKTRLVQAVAEALRAVALALPPGRLGAAAGDAAGTLAELVPDLRKLLDLPAYERAPAELQRRRSFEAVTSFVRGLADRQPLLLVVDDLHLAGASTLELLHFLLRRLAGDRVLVAGTVRDEEGAEVLSTLAEAGRVLELGSLPAEAVAELARRFGVAGLAAPVLERARGHTLFTVEALRAAAEAGRDQAGIPASLR
ncbi:MAG TPA: BTAD domain-containing putative transcriptional regulator, partial [Actinomycetota bacterium]